MINDTNGGEVMKEELVLKIEKIEALLVGSHYEEAYTIFCEISGPFPEFKDKAAKIMRRHNDYCQEIVAGTVSLTEKSILKNEIADSCMLCLRQFRKYLENARAANFIDNEEAVLKSNRQHFFRTQLKIEDEFFECKDPKKSGILKTILAEIRNILERLENLLRHFEKIREYEQI